MPATANEGQPEAVKAGGSAVDYQRVIGRAGVVVVFEPSAAALVDDVAWRTPGVEFVPARADDELRYDIALAAGPTEFLIEMLDQATPVVVPGCAEVRRYASAGGAILTGADGASVADGLRRLAELAPAARRVMGQMGRRSLRALLEGAEPEQ